MRSTAKTSSTAVCFIAVWSGREGQWVGEHQYVLFKTNIKENAHLSLQPVKQA